jgi:hypothetical protein
MSPQLCLIWPKSPLAKNKPEALKKSQWLGTKNGRGRLGQGQRSTLGNYFGFFAWSGLSPPIGLIF